MEIDTADVRGNLETIRNMADIGILLIDLNKTFYIPTVLENLMEYIQRLALEYASEEG